MARYVILGTGAIGGAIGVRLAEAGVDVVWVARGEQARAHAETGLTLRTPAGVVRAAAPVWSGPDDAELTADDVLIAAVKTQQVADLLATWADVEVPTGDGVRSAGAVLPVILATNGWPPRTWRCGGSGVCSACACGCRSPSSTPAR